MAYVPETATWEPGVYQFEETDVVQGGANGIDNTPGKQLANRTLYLKSQIEQLGADKQPADPLLTALAALITSADKALYFTGPDQPALAALTAYMRTVLAAADASAARAALGAAAPADIATAVAALVNASPATLDTLNELAIALGNDPNFATTIAAALALKAPLANPALTGTPTAPTAAPGTSTTQLANTAFVTAALAALGLGDYAKLAIAQLWTKAQRGQPVVLPALTGTVAIDLSAANNFYGQVTGNLTFGNGFTNPVAGQGGIIRVRQNGAILYNWAFGTYWKYVGGSSAIPAQTQTLAAYDEIVYHVHSANEISFSVRSDVK